MDRLSLTEEALGIRLPYNIEAEQAVIGASIVNSSLVDDVVSFLSPEHFYHEQNRAIYNEIYLMHTAGHPIDFITITDAVFTSKVFDTIEETKLYLFNVTQTVPSVTNITFYAQIIYDKYLIRSLINTARDIIENSNSSDDAKSMLEYAEQKIYEIRTGRNSSDLYVMKEVLLNTLEDLQKRSGPDREKYLGIRTGFHFLDNKINGLNKSDLIVLAARPSVGKTALALNIATNIVKKNTFDVAFFSLEMTANQLVGRILAAENSIDTNSFTKGNINIDEWKKIADSTEHLSKAQLYFDDTSGITVNEVKAKSRRLKNLGLIIVDYLQLMGSPGRHESRVQEVAEITRAFKVMAKELNVPVLLLSQLNRATERQARRPILSDLRDSGTIEQDADIVIFIHEPNKNAPKGSPDHDLPENSRVLMVQKNRHGETGNLYLHWEPTYTLFSTLELYYDD